jgi:hypothetical protein
MHETIFTADDYANLVGRSEVFCHANLGQPDRKPDIIAQLAVSPDNQALLAVEEEDVNRRLKAYQDWKHEQESLGKTIVSYQDSKALYAKVDKLRALIPGIKPWTGTTSKPAHGFNCIASPDAEWKSEPVFLYTGTSIYDAERQYLNGHDWFRDQFRLWVLGTKCLVRLYIDTRNPYETDYTWVYSNPGDFDTDARLQTFRASIENNKLSSYILPTKFDLCV